MVGRAVGNGAGTDDMDRLPPTAWPDDCPELEPPLGPAAGAGPWLGFEGDRGVAVRTVAGRSAAPPSPPGDADGADRERGPVDTDDGRSEGSSSGPDGRVTGFDGRPGVGATRLRATDDLVSSLPTLDGLVAMEAEGDVVANRGTA